MTMRIRRESIDEKHKKTWGAKITVDDCFIATLA